jgi:hypothetical protein
MVAPAAAVIRVIAAFVPRSRRRHPTATPRAKVLAELRASEIAADYPLRNRGLAGLPALPDLRRIVAANLEVAVKAGLVVG